VPTGTIIFNDTTAIAGTPYHYVVKAVNMAGEGPSSNEATATAMPGPQAPGSVVTIGYTKGSNYVSLWWNPPDNPGNPALMRYDIYRGESIGTLAYLANVTAGTLTYNDTTALDGNTYVYSVKAVNTVGSGPFGSYLTVELPVPGTPPGPPTSLTATGNHNSITLGWAAPVSGGVSNYLVYRGTVAGGEDSVPIATVTGTTYVNNNVVAGTAYFYKVKANNSYGQSAFSNEASATAEITIPGAPQNLVATPGEGKVTLTWEAPADDGGSPINGYNVYRQLGSASPELLGTVGASTLTYEDTSGTAGTAYTYFVVATNIIGAGEESVQVNAAPQAPSDDGGGMDTTTLLIIGVVVVVAIIAIAYFLMRRKP
jgi:cellulose 1,4-beta-cellobiosidase